MTSRGSTARLWMFAGICAASLAVAVLYGYSSIVRSRAQVSPRVLLGVAEVRRPFAPDTREAEVSETPVSTDTPTPAPAIPVPEPPGAHAAAHSLLLRHTELDRSFGAVAVQMVPGSDPRRAAPLKCDRVYARRDRGVCLTVDRSYTTNSLLVFDNRFDVVHRLPLAGLPSRARLSPDGRLAAVTVFVYGHSYGDGDFSTETSIIDTHTGARVVPTLQDLEVTRGAARFYAIDFNVWGVTFAADSDRFYATLRSGGRTHLVEGRVSSKRLRILRENVECPSLSPDNTTLVFKKRVSEDPAALWRLHALDLETMTETALAETRSVDDQVEWVDNQRILYALPRPDAPVGVTDLWVVPADGSGTPSVFLAGAASPAVGVF